VKKMKIAILLLCALLTLSMGTPCSAQGGIVQMELQEGEKLYGKKKYQDAEGKFKLVLRVTRKRNSRAHYFLARIYLEAEALRDTNKAQEHYKKAKRYRIKFEGRVEKIAVLEKRKIEEDRPSIEEMEILEDKQIENKEIGEEGKEEASAMESGAGTDSVLAGGPEPPDADIPLSEEEPIPSDQRSQGAVVPTYEGKEGMTSAADEATGGLQRDEVSTITSFREDSQAAEREEERTVRTIRAGESDQRQVPAPLVSAENYRAENERVAFSRGEEEISGVGITAEDAAAKLKSGLGECLRREKMGLPLDFGCKYSLHVFRVGGLMWQRKVDKGLYPEAEQFARDVIRVAPNFWVGYWLMAVTYLKRGDLVSVKNWWERAKRRDFVVVKNFYNLDPFILEPKEALHNSLLAGRRLMDTDTEEEKDWIAAEDALMAVQNINFTTKDDDIKKMLAEVYFRIGEIAYHLQDYEVAVQYLKYGIRQGYRPRHAGRLIEEAEKWAVYEWPMDPRLLSVHPIQFPEFPRGFGSVHLNLGGRKFLEVQTEIKEGKTQAKSAQELDAHIYGVAGGRAYKMVFDIRKQLRKAALQGGSAVLLMGILLML
jgi:tetratricopeptide (TPR) repeat protein